MTEPNKTIEGFADIEEDADGKVKVVFDPGCFDDFEGTQEELDEAVAMIQKMFEDGTALEQSRELDLDELMETDPETAEKIIRAIIREDGGDVPPTRTLQ
jgi:hypothetical protein